MSIDDAGQQRASGAKTPFPREPNRLVETFGYSGQTGSDDHTRARLPGYYPDGLGERLHIGYRRAGE